MFRILILLIVWAAPTLAQDIHATSAGNVRVDRVISGLDNPWAIAFTPDGGVLITELDGTLLYFADGKRTNVAGVPTVAARGQGGLLDVVVARDFETSRMVYLSYAEPRDGGAATALASARLPASGDKLTNLKVIFRMNRASAAKVHFGSRIVEAEDGTLFLTIGERGNRPLAQSLQHHNGKVIRIAKDGSIPADNPFAKDKDAPEIYSYGHRNPQGAALDARGVLWTVEHGPRGGDEINSPRAGSNYGWPVISFGKHYSGGAVGEGNSKVGMEQPKLYWDPSIAPSGMMIYSGKLWPAWRGDIFVGSLKFDMISRSDIKGNKVKEGERLFQDEYIRIRDIREASDGSIWFLAVGDGAAYRVTPSK